ncbi:MAG: DUF1028 domain-containing protein [Bryobacteraceae bacterium]
MNRAFRLAAAGLFVLTVSAREKPVASTFSIVARDPATGELGVAVASRYFAVGSVVPWAKAGVGAVATQSFVNPAFGPRGLDLLEKGMTPGQALKTLLAHDDDPNGRQVGIVSASGESVTYSGPKCNPWAGGRQGPNYAIQGNILTGESVVTAMEAAFLETKGTLASRLYAALAAGDSKGGDSRGRQSAALIVVKEGAGAGGYDDRAIDIRVDDNPDPFRELGRLLKLAETNHLWNTGWTAFERKRFPAALEAQERAAQIAPDNAELLYDLAVIRLANGRRMEALDALQKALTLNPKLKQQASKDNDLSALRPDPAFQALVK